MTKEEANRICLNLNNSLNRHEKAYYRVIFNVKTNSYEVVRVG